MIYVNVAMRGFRELTQALKRVGESPRQALARTAEEVETYVEDQAAKHSKTGKLFASVSKARNGPDDWMVGHNTQIAKHSLYVHWGARPHVIRPKNKKALRWPAGAHFAFAKKVNHPGNKADPWLTRAAAMAPLAFDRHVRALLEKRDGGQGS